MEGIHHSLVNFLETEGFKGDPRYAYIIRDRPGNRLLQNTLIAFGFPGNKRIKPLCTHLIRIR